jgi:phosphoglycolate phosphatase-like HAD superfamily hydrolase
VTGRDRPSDRSSDRAGGGLLDGIDLVVFDKDGTLIDFDAMWSPWIVELAARLERATGQPIAEQLFAELGFDPVAGRTIPGGPLAVLPMAILRDAVADVVVRAGATAVAAAEAVDEAWFVPDLVATARPLADLPRLFAALHAGGRRTAVATSDDHEPTARTLAGLGIADLVDFLIAADDGVARKPAPDMVLRAAAVVGVPTSRTAVVGDSLADLEMGRAAGAGRVIGVLSGVSGRADLEPFADAVVDSVADLAS